MSAIFLFCLMLALSMMIVMAGTIFAYEAHRDRHLFPHVHITKMVFGVLLVMFGSGILLFTIVIGINTTLAVTQ